MDSSIILYLKQNCYISGKSFGPERVGWKKEIWTPSSLSGNITDLFLGGADFRSCLGHQYNLPETFHGFLQSLQASAGIVPEIRS